MNRQPLSTLFHSGYTPIRRFDPAGSKPWNQFFTQRNVTTVNHPVMTLSFEFSEKEALEAATRIREKQPLHGHAKEATTAIDTSSHSTTLTSGSGPVLHKLLLPTHIRTTTLSMALQDRNFGTELQFSFNLYHGFLADSLHTYGFRTRSSRILHSKNWRSMLDNAVPFLHNNKNDDKSTKSSSDDNEVKIIPFAGRNRASTMSAESFVRRCLNNPDNVLNAFQTIKESEYYYLLPSPEYEWKVRSWNITQDETIPLYIPVYYISFNEDKQKKEDRPRCSRQEPKKNILVSAYDKYTYRTCEINTSLMQGYDSMYPLNEL